MSSATPTDMTASLVSVPGTCPHCGLHLAPIDPGTLAPVLCPACRLQVRSAIRPRLPPSRRALASLVLAGLSTAGGLFTGVPAIVLGALALRDIRRRPTQVGGTAIAIAGMLAGAVLSVAFLPCHAGVLFSLLANWERLSSRKGGEDVVTDATRLQDELPSWHIGTLPSSLRPYEQRTRRLPYLGTQRWLVLADASRQTVVVLAELAEADTLGPQWYRIEAQRYRDRPMAHAWQQGRVAELESPWHCQVRGQQVEVTERYFKVDGERRYVVEFEVMVVQPGGRRFVLWTTLVDLAGPLEPHRATVREPVRALLESW